MQEMPKLLVMTNEEYHSDNTRVSNSGLTLLAKSPAHYYARHLAADREAPTPTDAMELGTLCHTAILEPEGCNQWRPLAKHNRTTNVGKEAHAKEMAEIEKGGFKAVAAADYDLAMRMRDSAFRHAGAAWLLNASSPRIAEGTVHFTEPETGVNCKARPDLLTRPNSNLWGVDVKTTEDASPEGFGKSVANYRYFVQAPFYLDGLAAAGYERPEAFAFIAIEKKPPFAVAVYYLPDAIVEQGRQVYLQNLHTYAQCVDSGQWPAYPAGIQELTLPRWFKL